MIADAPMKRVIALFMLRKRSVKQAEACSKLTLAEIVFKLLASL
jgi:hypothetical protein